MSAELRRDEVFRISWWSCQCGCAGRIRVADLVVKVRRQAGKPTDVWYLQGHEPKETTAA